MEQDSRTMSLLINVSNRLRELPKIKIYSSNFTEAPGVYIESETWKEFIPALTSKAELEAKVEALRNRVRHS